MTRTGWYNRNKLGNSVKHESHRHSLAAKGIKTALPKGVKNVSFSGSPTPNFDMVKNGQKETNMCLADYHSLLGRLGFRGKDRRVHDDHVHINIYGKWHKVEKGTIRQLGRLHKALNDIETKLELTAPRGKETIISFGDAKVTEKGLKEVVKLPFISKDFAKKHRGKPVNIVFRDILDKLPYGKNFTRKNAIMYADMVIAKDALRQLKAWEVKKLMQFSMVEKPQRKRTLKQAVSELSDKKYEEHKAYMNRTLYYSGRYQNRERNATPPERRKYAYEGRELRRKLNDVLYINETKQKEQKRCNKKALSIVLLASKAKHFDFLEGKTKWASIGDWKGFQKEKNVVLDIEYLDNDSNKYTSRLMHLLKQYNKSIVGEELLYCRVIDLYDSSYDPSD